MGAAPQEEATGLLLQAEGHEIRDHGKAGAMMLNELAAAHDRTMAGRVIALERRIDELQEATTRIMAAMTKLMDKLDAKQGR
jgi:hypothetical protein